MSAKDGMNYAPQGKPNPVCKPGDFVFAAAALDHGHIGGQCNGLVEAGGQLKWVYDPDAAKVERLLTRFPGAKAASSLDQILEDAEVRMVAAAAVPSERGPLGCRVLRAGKDYFTDKSPFTTLEQLGEARKTCAETGRKYAVYYSERLHTESAMHASALVEDGVIGRVIQVLGLGPHRLNAPSRPEWFFDKSKYGGILTDIGSHQAEQFLFFAGAADATVLHARVENFNNPDHPGLEDFGEASFVADNGASNYMRVDWFTPDGLSVWGDGRMFILGTKGYIELRKYLNVGVPEAGGDHVFLVTNDSEEHIPVAGKVGYPFFGRLILDCLNGTEKAMTQEHIFKAAEISMKAQVFADARRTEQTA